MQPIPVPAKAKRMRPEHQLVTMGRPAGVPAEECGDAEMLLSARSPLTNFGGRDQFAYFKPTQEELDLLNAGGYLELNQVGTIVQPFSLQVWADDPEETPDAHTG